ncbi:MAG TPA: hypothetical protein VM869_15050 [Enhygromyxa sp.]|nr:hypothetical protein [Enhygromyxa sp.]
MNWHSRAVAEQPKPKRKPRLGIIIRLAIYLPLLGFFGWRAWDRFTTERDAADEVFRERVGAWLEHPPQTIVLPNGEALPMMTPEQAEAQGFDLPASLAEGTPEPAPAPEPAQ